MFDVHLDLNDLNISSVEKEDIISIQKWINDQNYGSNDIEKQLGLREFYERFLEYYVSEGEFFLKITKDNNLIGVLKGRIEFKNPTEVWLWYFLIDKDYRGRGIGSGIISSVKEYFNDGFGIDNFYTGVCAEDTDVLRFWKKNGFTLIRVSKGFFSVDEKDRDMMIMKNTL
jgi:RimJ/RimL family protein N-acetyltransferase